MNENNNPELIDPVASKTKKQWFSDEQRKKHYQDYKESGLSVESYCQLNSISQSALRKWVTKFNPKPSFVPITPENCISDVKQSFEIILSNGLRIRFPELTNLVVVKQIIREMNSCS
jgi:transposase